MRRRSTTRTRMPALAAPALAVFTACTLLSGCHSAVSPFNAHGPAARSISHLMLFMKILFIVITTTMWLLFAFAFYKRRGTLALHDPINESGGEAWIVIGGIAVPLIVLTVLFVMGLGLLRDFPIHGMHGGGTVHAQMVQSMKPEIEIIGHQWWWEIKYLNDDPSQEFTTANELHLPQGRPINIEVVTRDVMHSFWIPQLHGKVDLIPGMTNYIRLEATDAGHYTGQCAEYCGEEHARMRIYAVVEDEDSYQAWKQHQLTNGVQPTPDEPVAFQGQQVFLNGPCVMCHTVRGTQAGGSVAPDLTHIGSRAYIAGNSCMNNDAYLEAWISRVKTRECLCRCRCRCRCHCLCCCPSFCHSRRESAFVFAFAFAFAVTLTPTMPRSTKLDEKIATLPDWRGKTLAHIRALIHAADPEITEEWKWAKPTAPGVPVFSRNGIICTGETYKSAVKLTFAKGASLPDPAHLFNASLEGNVRRAIDLHENDTLNETAFKDLIRAAVALNLQKKPKR